MKKIVLVLLVVLAVGLVTSPTLAKNQKARGIWLGLGIGAAAATIFNGIEHGRWSPVITRERERVYYPPSPPPVYYSSAPPSSTYSAPPRSYPYSHSAFSWQGARIALSDRGGWGDAASVRGVIVDAFLSWGAEVFIAAGRQVEVDAPYALEIQARSEGNRAVVEIWVIERSSGAVRVHGLDAAEFYYDGSDQWRSYQWAAQRALANLR